MNRHERRRRPAKLRRPPPPRREWVRDMHAFLADTGGVFRTMVLRKHHLTWIVARSMAGEAVASAALSVIAHWLTHCPDPSVADCFVCCDALRAIPPVFVVAVPERADPSSTLVGAVCTSCSGRSDDELIQACLPALRTILADARVIDPAMVGMTGGSA